MPFQTKLSTNIDRLFLQFVRLGIGHTVDTAYIENALSGKVDWEALKDLAEKQGLSAIVLDGIVRLHAVSKLSINPVLKIQWIGEVTQFYENRYLQYAQSIAEMAGFYNTHGYKMMVLKGYGCSLDWPKPNHRPCGDIDIWQFGQYKEADSALTKDKGIKIDSSHHHHTVFNWQDFMVENHYDFINVHHHKSHVEFEKILKELAQDDSYYVKVNGEIVYLPSPNLHALFLLKHLMLHFATNEVNFRQLLDWAFFIKAHGKDVDWKWLGSVLVKFGMIQLFNIFNAICVDELGFEMSLFPPIQFEPELKERVLQDILSFEREQTTPLPFFRRMIFKYRRWKANEWKHELCFNESMWSAFWSGVWSHLLKPKSI